MNDAASASSSNADSAGAGITGGYEGNSFTLKVCIAFFSGLAMYNVLELLVLIFSTFQRYGKRNRAGYAADDGQIPGLVFLVAGRIDHGHNTLLSRLFVSALLQQTRTGPACVPCFHPAIYRSITTQAY